MTHPDGWKDEEGDVNPLKPNAEFKQVRDWVKAPDTSARSCGCDAGAGWVCAWHQKLKVDNDR